MGLLDKVKSTATQAMAGTAQVTSQVSTQVSAKVEQVQLRKKADDAARQLGYLVVRQHEGAALDQTEVERLVGVVRDAEAQIRRAGEPQTAQSGARPADERAAGQGAGGPSADEATATAGTGGSAAEGGSADDAAADAETEGGAPSA